MAEWNLNNSFPTPFFPPGIKLNWVVARQRTTRAGSLCEPVCLRYHRSTSKNTLHLQGTSGLSLTKHPKRVDKTKTDIQDIYFYQFFRFVYPFYFTSSLPLRLLYGLPGFFFQHFLIRGTNCSIVTCTPIEDEIGPLGLSPGNLLST